MDVTFRKVLEKPIMKMLDSVVKGLLLWYDIIEWSQKLRVSSRFITFLVVANLQDSSL